MKTSIAVLVLLVVAGVVYTQPPPPIPAPEGPTLPRVPAAPSVQDGPSQPKERSVNQLLDEIQAVRKQKDELAKKEQALMAEVRKLVDQQNERLNKMGLGTPVQPPQSVDVGVPSTSFIPTTPGVPPPGAGFPVPDKR